jgi:hypothetical protein
MNTNQPTCPNCNDTGRIDTGVPLTYKRCTCEAGTGRISKHEPRKEGDEPCHETLTNTTPQQERGSNAAPESNPPAAATPRTDDAQWGTGKVTTDFARTLERELTAALARIAELEAQAEQDPRTIKIG